MNIKKWNINKKFLSKRTTNLYDKSVIKNRFNLIKMNSVKNNENELLTISDETMSEKDTENEISSNSLNYYEHLFLFYDYLYITIERVNNNLIKIKTSKNLNQISSISSKVLFKFGSIINVSGNKNEIIIKMCDERFTKYNIKW